MHNGLHSFQTSKNVTCNKNIQVFLLICHPQAPEKVMYIKAFPSCHRSVNTTSRDWRSELTFDKCCSTVLGTLPESLVATSVIGLDVKLLPVARMHTLGVSGSSPAWLISLCNAIASAEGVDIIPQKKNHQHANKSADKRSSMGGLQQPKEQGGGNQIIDFSDLVLLMTK